MFHPSVVSALLWGGQSGLMLVAVPVAVVVDGSLILSCDGVLATRLPPQERLSYQTALPSPPPLP